MNKTLKSVCAAVVLLAATATSHSTLVIAISGGDFLTAAGTPVATSTLFQLVNLGPNNVFDEINVNDATNTGLGRWTSLDDTVIDIAIIGGDSAVFPSTKAFDVSAAAVEAAGILDRVFQFASNAFPQNTNIGIRWFPGLTATSFDGITLAAGQSYGQFTRSVPVNGNSPWRVLSPDGNLTFDQMLTTNQGGTDSSAAGGVARAGLVVVPEPAAIGLSLLGAAGLSMLRRRRA